MLLLYFLHFVKFLLNKHGMVWYGMVWYGMVFVPSENS